MKKQLLTLLLGTVFVHEATMQAFSWSSLFTPLQQNYQTNSSRYFWSGIAAATILGVGYLWRKNSYYNIEIRFTRESYPPRECLDKLEGLPETVEKEVRKEFVKILNNNQEYGTAKLPFRTSRPLSLASWNALKPNKFADIINLYHSRYKLTYGTMLAYLTIYPQQIAVEINSTNGKPFNPQAVWE